METTAPRRPETGRSKECSVGVLILQGDLYSSSQGTHDATNDGFERACFNLSLTADVALFLSSNGTAAGNSPRHQILTIVLAENGN